MDADKNNNLKIELKLPSVQELLGAGVHFGHKTSRWHPKMEQYIFSSRNDVHIFDLEKTLKKLEEALVFLRGIIAKNGTLLLVGTKPAAKAIVKETAQALNQPFVVQRWLGGTLTNFKTIAKRLAYWRELEEQQKSDTFQNYTKKERLQFQKKLAKLQEQMEGIKNLTVLPVAILVADTKVDNLAVREAKRMKLPVVAICDTNSDPSLIDYSIPANDDAVSSLKILFETIVQNLQGLKVAPPTTVAENITHAPESHPAERSG